MNVRTTLVLTALTAALWGCSTQPSSQSTPAVGGGGAATGGVTATTTGGGTGTGNTAGATAADPHSQKANP